MFSKVHDSWEAERTSSMPAERTESMMAERTASMTAERTASMPAESLVSGNGREMNRFTAVSHFGRQDVRRMPYIPAVSHHMELNGREIWEIPAVLVVSDRIEKIGWLAGR